MDEIEADLARVVADEVDDAPAVLPLLDVLHGELRHFRSPQTAPDEQGENGAVPRADDLLLVRHSQHRLGLVERQPVAGALAERFGAADAVDGVGGLHRDQTVIRRLLRQPAQGRQAHVDGNRAQFPFDQRCPPFGHDGAREAGAGGGDVPALELIDGAGVGTPRFRRVERFQEEFAQRHPGNARYRARRRWKFKELGSRRHTLHLSPGNRHYRTQKM